MNRWIGSLVDASVQCWGCSVFDNLFRIVSDSAAAVYDKFVWFAITIFSILFAFFVINAVWQNMKDGGKDPVYKGTMKPVLINSLFALAFLTMGVGLPRFVTTITFEPVAEITLIYTQGILRTDNAAVNNRIDYSPLPISDDGFFRPKLRDTILMLIKTTVTQFQIYIKLGIAVLEQAFTWNALRGIGAFIKHLMLVIIGGFLSYQFGKLFFKFCFNFADVILAMTFFAFFFPLSLVMMAFKDAKNVPSWMSGLGRGLGAAQLKTMINSIVGLGAAVLTYTIIMVIIAKFFAASGVSAEELMQQILTNDDVFNAELSDENLVGMTLMGASVLVYIINFLYAQIPQITSMVLSAFNVKSETTESDKLATGATKLVNLAKDQIKKAGQTVLSKETNAAAGTPTGSTTPKG